ncbi:MAG: hypothetical protein AAF529_10260, partial [Pseudomonadota bacterium]
PRAYTADGVVSVGHWLASHAAQQADRDVEIGPDFTARFRAVWTRMKDEQHRLDALRSQAMSMTLLQGRRAQTEESRERDAAA